MSHIPAWTMEVEVRCSVCDRPLTVTLAECANLPRLLREQGACVVGPNQQGLLLVEGCGRCTRYTSQLKNGSRGRKGGAR